MGLLSRRGKTVPTADPRLGDGAWIAESERIFRSRIEKFYGSPETMADGGLEHYGQQDFGTALFFFAKSVDMLDTAYGFSQMRDRRPSPADTRIVDGFVSALEAAISTHPEAPVGQMTETVAGQLRLIASECDRVGAPSAHYMIALGQIEELAGPG